MEEEQENQQSWSIAVKAVGKGAGEENFTVLVNPEDDLNSLHHKIEAKTGLKSSQQRLIYRGRMIGPSPSNQCTRSSVYATGESEDSSTLTTEALKIGDIRGLGDGQTIHLVQKREPNTNDDDPNSQEGRPGLSSSINSPRNSSSILRNSGSGPSSGSLLSALLGLGDGRNGGTVGPTTTAPNSVTPDQGRPSPRLRPNSMSRRRPHYRLARDDLQLPDPGSLEPVRQGLMTLHTLLPHAREQIMSDEYHPLQANRTWYVGQWIDCRDTVNQWLEATVVEIVSPADILPNARRNTNMPSAPDGVNERKFRIPSDDPAVSASDLEGRRRLLLEECEEGHPDEEEGDLAGYKQRDYNEGVKLLLIHYNGWPPRWDEWIRSDSERIRPFRSRTRHSTASNWISPRPQSAFHDAPRTNIGRGHDDSADRSVLLPELGRAIDTVNNLLQEIVAGNSVEESTVDESATTRDNLPWVTPSFGVSDNNRDDSSVPDLLPRDSFDNDDDIMIPTDYDVSELVGGENIEDSSDSDDSEEQEASETHPSAPQYNRRHLETLAPLLDRLGRTLVDAAPQVAALAASLPDIEESSTSNPPLQEEEQVQEQDTSDLPLSGLLSILSHGERNDDSLDMSSYGGVDPDHVDFASGLVNTHRGQVRTGPRGRSSNDELANILGAYLAAASLGGLGVGSDDGDSLSGLSRLLRDRGSGGGGIDIHIHAVVASPGGGGGNMDLGPFGAGLQASPLGGGTTRNLFSTPRDRRAGRSLLRSARSLRSHHNELSQAHSSDDDNDEEAHGLFSELYGETPTPLNRNETESSLNEGSDLQVPGSVTSRINASVSGQTGPYTGWRSHSHRSNTSSSDPDPENTPERRSSGWSRLFRRRGRERDP